MKKRIITAIILSLLMASAILYSPKFIFQGLTLLITLGGLYEFFKLVLPPESVYKDVGWIYGLLVSASILFLNGFSTVAILIAGLFVLSLIHMKHTTAPEGSTSRIAVTLLGVIYLGTTLPFWSLLRDLDHGKALVFMGIAAAALSDTFAMFAGKTIGRHKMAPMTSPNKTMEGFVFGFLGSVFGVMVVKFIGYKDLSFVHAVMLGLMVGFVGPMGDLIESLFKRDYHVKDSGTVIPGHGGILDRLDAMIFTGPAVYLYAKYIIGV